MILKFLGEDGVRESCVTHLTIELLEKRRETMKIAALVLCSLMLMMMASSATLFSFQKDRPAEVDRAEQSLHTAKSELEHAGTEWGGHRVQAIKHIDAALHELELAEQWARQHREIK
jgi:hypothetical protein